MRQVGELIKRTQIDSGNKQWKRSENLNQWSVETHKIVLGLFARFGDLFGELARSKGLEIKDNNGEYTRIFELWCRKLDGLTVEQIANGVENIEKRIEESVKNGEKVYTPSYSEFRGYCMIANNKKAIYTDFKPLPPPKMTSKEKKEAMKKLRGESGL